MIFNTPYERKRSTPEVNSGEILVERAGYITAQQRIENLLLAGQRLVQARKEMYDFPDGKIDPSYIDPTRRKGYDMADAFQDSQKVNERLKSQKEALKASQTVPEAPDEASKQKAEGE